MVLQQCRPEKVRKPHTDVSPCQLFRVARVRGQLVMITARDEASGIRLLMWLHAGSSGCQLRKSFTCQYVKDIDLVFLEGD